jgi:hypothetical protein
MTFLNAGFGHNLTVFWQRQSNWAYKTALAANVAKCQNKVKKQSNLSELEFCCKKLIILNFTSTPFMKKFPFAWFGLYRKWLQGAPNPNQINHNMFFA